MLLAMPVPVIAFNGFHIGWKENKLYVDICKQHGVYLDMAMSKHPSKEIQKAIDYAVENGWRVIEPGKSSHAFCRLYCPEQSRKGCQLSVWSTQRNEGNHSRQIFRQVDRCTHHS